MTEENLSRTATASTRDDIRDGDGQTRALGDRGRGAHKQSRTDHGTNPQRDERERAQRAFASTQQLSARFAMEKRRRRKLRCRETGVMPQTASQLSLALLANAEVGEP